MAKHKGMKELLESLKKLEGVMPTKKFDLMLREQAIDNERRAIHLEEEAMQESEHMDEINGPTIVAAEVEVITEMVNDTEEKKRKKK